jgi:nucleotide-binding universal stress UspA family protein
MRILHPTDFSHTAERARTLALDLTERLAAELRVVHVLQHFEAHGGAPYVRAYLDAMEPSLKQRLAEEREREAARLRERLRALAGPHGTPELVAGEPLRELLAMAPDHDLVVMGAHGQSPLDDVFLGGTAGRLVRRTSTPVLTARETCTVTTVRRLLVASDFGEASLSAWTFAAELAGRGNLKLVLAHVTESQRNDTAAVSARLETLAAGRAERLAVRPGNPIDVLPAIAQDLGADAIVVGLRRQGRVAGLILGSRADALLRSSPVPILSVPSR